jgi:hypothetical protein
VYVNETTEATATEAISKKSQENQLNERYEEQQEAVELKTTTSKPIQIIKKKPKVSKIDVEEEYVTTKLCITTTSSNSDAHASLACLCWSSF